MENNKETVRLTVSEKDKSSNKTCPHCQQIVPSKATRCQYCQGDLRSWVARHPILTVLGVIVLLIIIGNIGSGSQPSPASQNTTPTNKVDSLMSQNNPTIKVLGTLPTNYIGKTFALYVNAQTDRYYNYGFNDENSYYSVKIWDNSVSGDYDGVYAYLPKNSQNADLINKALNNPVFIKVEASVPSDKWEDNSNAFLQINSWSYQ